MTASGFRAAREAVLRNAGEVLQGLTPGSSPRRRAGSRKTSFNEPEEDNSSDGVRGKYTRLYCVVISTASSASKYIFDLMCW